MKTLSIIIFIVLVLHGLIHLMRTVTYLKLGSVQGLVYKTALLDGRLKLEERGVGIYGALWAVATIGFIVAAEALVFRWAWWKPFLAGVTLFSLALTSLDWKDASAGAVVNIVLLAWVWLAPYNVQ